MDERVIFYPPKQVGTLIHILLILLFSSGGAWGIWGVGRVEVALELLPYLTLIILFLIAVPILIYRLYALNRSGYILERAGIQLNWGWRTETIPMEEVKWVHFTSDLETPPKLPVIHWPGSIVGRRRFQRGPEVEFLASRYKDLIVISAGDGYFCISPNQASDFIAAYHQLTELGSLAPMSVQSLRPSLILTEVIESKPVLLMILLGGFLNISLLVWILIVIPNNELISLGFNPAGVPREPLGSIRLILFPILNTTAYLANLIMGLFLFQNPDNRRLAHILWGGSIVIAIVFHIGLMIILN
jgi:hypothetical protein